MAKDKPFTFDTVSWTQDLAHQHGNSIHCLPYEFTPFSLRDALCKRMEAEHSSLYGHVLAQMKNVFHPHTLDSSFVRVTLVQ